MKLKTALLGAVAAIALPPPPLPNAAPMAMSTCSTGRPVDPEPLPVVGHQGRLNRLAGAGSRWPASTKRAWWSPALAEDIPTVENGGISADLTSITWKLKPGLKWSDGTPSPRPTPSFTYEYCTHPEGGCAQAKSTKASTSGRDARRPDHRHHLQGAEAEPLHRLRRRHLADPAEGAVRQLPGRRGPTCTEQNFNPIGTGPFMVTDFKVNDVVDGRQPELPRPGQARLRHRRVKGGGDAAGSARAVMETGEFDYAWNTQINPDVQAQMAAAGKGVRAERPSARWSSGSR
jgi:peptide/nickel transport system substrate-binding protein